MDSGIYLDYLDMSSLDNVSSSAAADFSNTSMPQCMDSSATLARLSLSSSAAANSIEKPPEPYADMIAKAILSSPSNMLQLKGIYDYISQK
jgi:hypothetical protein